MKRVILHAVLGLSAVCVSTWANTIPAKLWCVSVVFSRGTNASGFTLDLTRLPWGVNGELGPWFSTYSHWSWFELGLGFGSVPGTILLDVPLRTDANGNGFSDFFESAQAVSGTTDGYAWDDYGLLDEPVTAVWTRPAGSTTGTCRITFPTLGTFTNSFRILEFNGQLTYAPGQTNVLATLVVTQVDNATAILTGSMVFLKDPQDPHSLLRLAPGCLTNQLGASLCYTNDGITRDAGWPTNYFGWIDFEDGDPVTAAPDFRFWMFSFDDLNDADADGIPDFSDEPLQPVVPPVITIGIAGNQLRLDITGQVGRTCQLLQTVAVSPPNWTTNTQFTLTSSVHTLYIPVDSATKFFKLRVSN